ncbi:unnamed protein product [Musa acuminata subsp. burmannicoides]
MEGSDGLLKLRRSLGGYVLIQHSYKLSYLYPSVGLVFGFNDCCSCSHSFLFFLVYLSEQMWEWFWLLVRGC